MSDKIKEKLLEVLDEVLDEVVDPVVTVSIVNGPITDLRQLAAAVVKGRLNSLGFYNLEDWEDAGMNDSGISLTVALFQLTDDEIANVPREVKEQISGGYDLPKLISAASQCWDEIPL